MASQISSIDAIAHVGRFGICQVASPRTGIASQIGISLLVADAVAADAGGGLDTVVMVSGRSWHEAVVAASVAGSLGAPVLMTPPHEVRDDALEFLDRIEASRVLLVSTDTESGRSIDVAVDEQLRGAGLTVERVNGSDQYLTGVAVAERLGAAGELGRLGTTAIIASGEVFADALVAGPLSAHRGLPVLLTPQAELHAEVADYLDSAGIERVVLMGGTAALSDEVENAVVDLGIAVDRMAGASRFETATLAAAYAAEHAGESCFAGAKAGLARARVPFDSFSAAPLLARRCAALVLTDPDEVPESTAEYLDGVRRTAREGAAQLLVFGGEVAVSQAAIDEFLTGGADESEEIAAGSCGGGIGGQPEPLLPGVSGVKEADWSPDCRSIAFVNRSELWVMDNDGEDARKVLSFQGPSSSDVKLISNPQWSPDGTKFAFAVRSWEGSDSYAGQRNHIYVSDADGTNAVQVTTGTVEDDKPSWSPDGSRIAFQRQTWTDRTVSPPVGDRRFIVTIDPDGSNLKEIGSKDLANAAPAWSPDGTKFALLSQGTKISTMNVDGSNLQTWFWIESRQRADTQGTGIQDIIGDEFSKLSWSPDSSQIAFAWRPFIGVGLNAGFSASSGTVDIAVLNIETGTMTEITSTEGRERNPDWSPDGRRLLFNSYADHDGRTSLFVVGAPDS